jgi:hypothetical protein
MGGTTSRPDSRPDGGYSTNDYELVIKASKTLETIFERDFHTQGRGLHEHINSAADNHIPIPAAVVKKLRFIATIRNKLIHDSNFNQVPDRSVFMQLYEECKVALSDLAMARNRSQHPVSSSSTNTECTIS